VRIVRTQHPCHLGEGGRWADVDEPDPEARLLFVEWPTDAGWPVQITWQIDSRPSPWAVRDLPEQG
jgi:hypothetical protein